MTLASALSEGRLAARDEADALEELHRLGCTDGLPVVIPTPERVARMVAATCLDADLVLGNMGPGFGSCTIEKLAIAAVMAGCLPEVVPVVLAATRAVLDPTFDLTEMQATTHCTAPLIIINGPARELCGGIASGVGALGPGHRANATIGRALRLAMINIGGGRAGISDMALLGHPGKFTFCLAENEEESPFTPLHVGRGFERDQSVATVVGAEPPHSVMGVTDANDPTSADRLLTSLALALANVGANNASLRGGAAVVVLNPEHAAVLGAAGHTRASVAQVIYERAANSGATLARTAAFPVGDATRELQCFASPDDVLLMVAGGSGLYSAVMPSWCAGPHRNRAVSVPIDVAPVCEIPGRA